MKKRRIIAFIMALLISVCSKSNFAMAEDQKALIGEATNGARELGTAKKLLYETARILVSKNNMVVVDEISQYDWYWATDASITAPYINDFTNAIKKHIHQPKERTSPIFIWNNITNIFQ